jgi:tRNA A37 N6-isopentenylltransferase MiaA
MDNLIIALLIIGGGYYLLTKPTKNKSQTTQTDDNLDEKEVEIDTLTRKNKELEAQIIADNKSYQSRIKEKDNEIKRIQNEARELAKRPLKPTKSKGTQTDPETELTNTLDILIKEVQEFNLKI